MSSLPYFSRTFVFVAVWIAVGSCSWILVWSQPCPYGPVWHECQWDYASVSVNDACSSCPCYLNPPDGPIIIRSNVGPAGEQCWCYSQLDTVVPIDMDSGSQWFLTVNGKLVVSGHGIEMDFFYDWRTNCQCEDEIQFVVTCPPNSAVMQYHRTLDCVGCQL